ncbi:hypothetical protein GCM10027037_31520 [Mucilaginibacter koreensis]
MPQYLIQTPKAILKTITIIHLALLAGQVLFGIVFFFLRSSGTDPQANLDIFKYLVPAIAVVMVALSQFIFPKLIAKAIPLPALQEKMAAYQSALIVCYALLEVPSLFSLVAYFLTGNILYILVAALLVARFVTIRPTAEKAEEDLKLTYEEKLELQ